jgi:hypothetical protein
MQLLSSKSLFVFGSFSDDPGSGLAGVLFGDCFSCGNTLIMAHRGVLPGKFADQSALLASFHAAFRTWNSQAWF